MVGADLSRFPRSAHARKVASCLADGSDFMNRTRYTLALLQPITDQLVSCQFSRMPYYSRRRTCLAPQEGLQSDGATVLTVYKAFADILARLRAVGDGTYWMGPRHAGRASRRALPAWRNLVEPLNFNNGSIGDGDVEMVIAARDYMIDLVEERRSKLQPDQLDAAYYLDPALSAATRAQLSIDPVFRAMRDFPAMPGRADAAAARRELAELARDGRLPGTGDMSCPWNHFVDDPVLYYDTIRKSSDYRASEFKNLAEFCLRLFSKVVTTAGTERAWKTATNVYDAAGPNISSEGLEQRTLCAHMLANLVPSFDVWEVKPSAAPAPQTPEAMWNAIDALGDDVEESKADPLLN